MNSLKKTVVIGATPNTQRYAYMAAQRLHNANMPFVPVGIKKGELFGVPILPITEKPVVKDVHTVTLYIGPANQVQWYDYILSLNPKRIVFNPGTENPELEQLAQAKEIETLHACTLVMLGSGTY